MRVLYETALLSYLQNIDDVLQRGAVLSEMENKSQNLTEMSRKYRFGLLILDFHKKDQMENHFLQQHIQERRGES